LTGCTVDLALVYQHPYIWSPRVVCSTLNLLTSSYPSCDNRTSSSFPMSHRPCDTFRETLAINYPDYGHALWEPSPGGLHDAVEVGDVGFIRNGCFHRLFNISLPGDHPSHQKFGVPESHEPLRLENFIHEGTEGTKDFCSKSANLSRVPDVYASG